MLLYIIVLLNSITILLLAISNRRNTKLIRQILESKWFPTPREVRKDEV